MNYAPLKFYQLHFQVRKNISTSKRFQKHLSSGQQTLGGRTSISPAGWGWAPRWQGPSTLGIKSAGSKTGSSEPLLCQPLTAQPS